MNKTLAVIVALMVLGAIALFVGIFLAHGLGAALITAGFLLIFVPLLAGGVLGT